MNTTLKTLLDLDLSTLESARELVDPKYAHAIQISWELVVFYGAFLLVGLWLYWVYQKNNDYKKKALSIFFTIMAVFILYALINLGIPQWRPGAMEAVHGIAPLIPHPIDNSFPSGHALFTWALLVALYRYFRHTSIIWVTAIIGVITLVSRVVGWVHYPGDILGGLFFGIIGGLIVVPLVQYIVTKTAPIFIKIASWIGL